MLENHGLSALTLERFTKETTKRYLPGRSRSSLTGRRSWSSAPNCVLWQNFYRQFGEMPDIMVCGEMDWSDSDFYSVVTDPRVAPRDTGLKPMSRWRAVEVACHGTPSA